jgi:hypothetical protein
MRRRSRWQVGCLVAAVALVLSLTPGASAQEGGSTPGAVVTAVNGGRSPLGTDLRLSLTAQAEPSTVTDPSCRPQDLNLRCWGSLYLRIPDLGAMTMKRFEVHRVAVGDIGCGGCGDHEGTMSAVVSAFPVQAQVNGLAVVTKPGSSGLAKGDEVQVKITLWDNGTARYDDAAQVVVNKFVPGSIKPPIFDSGEVTIQQVLVYLPDDGG